MTAETTLPSSGKSTLTKLSIMMFLQFFAWGSWFVTLALALGSNDLGAIIGGAFESAPIAAIFAPLFLGLIADRFFPSEKVMGVLMVIGSGLMAYIAYIAPQGATAGPTIITLMIAYMCCYMPTLGLANTITFTHLPQEQFPKARVWGTIGWIVAGLFLGFSQLSSSLQIFWIAAAASLALGIYSFFLPSTPAPAKDQPLNLRSLLMLDAFKLCKNPAFAVFAVCSTLICIPLAYYYAKTADFLKATGYTEPASFMSIGQMSEIFFMLLIPFFFRKLGVKLMLLIGMGCWVARYALFAYGAPDQIAWMLFAGVALHGICYDFFFVTGFIYTDKTAPKAIRGQAQALLVFLTQGLGMFFGFRFAFGGNFPFTDAKLPNTITQGESIYGNPPSGDLILAIKDANTGAPDKGSLEQLGGMFGKGYPEGIDQEIVTKNMTEWQDFWYFPMILAAAIFVIFAILFWDKVKTDDVDLEEATKAASPDSESAV
ncbi:MAG: nucleoside transporter [Rubritalea sp.]|jgi:nucleoside transporter|tara:strand:+ start:653 stop:2110 length:1458 start_codon:yes stop_codon:yes gene_type:complete